MARVHASFNGAFEVHIWLCNSLARTNRLIFEASNLAVDASSKIPKSTLAQYLALNLQTHEEHAASRMTDLKIVGICTSNTAVGDKVLLLSGLQVPLVVRSSDSELLLVSPAVVECRKIGEVEGRVVLEGELEEFVLS